jgi:hypothetical protein
VRGAVAGFPGSLRTSRPAGAPGPVGRDCYKHPPPMGAGSLTAWLDQARSINQKGMRNAGITVLRFPFGERAWNWSRPGVAEKRLPRADLRSPFGTRTQTQSADKGSRPASLRSTRQSNQPLEVKADFFDTLGDARGPKQPPPWVVVRAIC